MPKFLEQKLKAEYPGNDRAVYGTLNNIGAMRGNKETPKGKAMDKKHAAKIAATKTAPPFAKAAPPFTKAAPVSKSASAAKASKPAPNAPGSLVMDRKPWHQK